MVALVERCEHAMARNAESEAVRGWRAAIEAARKGDGGAAAEALATLPEKPRFAATIVLGLAFPDVLVATAVAYDGAVAEGTVALDWQRCCEYLTVMRWAAYARGVEPRTLGRLLKRAYYGAAGVALLAAIRDRAARKDFGAARELYAAIPKLAKEERGAACVVIGVATEDEKRLHEAVTIATSKPIIQDGGEEAEALAAVLGEMATALAPSHEAVQACVDALVAWQKPVAKDVRSYGIALAAQTCVRAGWIEHARTLAKAVYGGREAVEAAIASGVAAPAPQRTLSEPTLEEIAAESYADHRISKGTARALGRLDANDREAALAAVTAALAAGDAGAGTATAEQRVAWARALAAGGRRADAIGVLTSLLPGGLPRSGCELAVELLATDARPFVEAAIAHGLAAVSFSWSSTTEPPAALFLAQLVARTGDPDLECQLIAATAVVGRHEDSDGAVVAAQRVHRVSETLRVLADAYPELADATPTAERLDAWTAALGDHPASRGLIGAAAAALAASPLDAITARCGGEIRTQHVRALAAEIAKRGRLAEALALVDRYEPRTQQPAYVAIARAITTPADRKKLVATFKKSKKTGRDRDAQGMWKFNHGAILLATGDIDGALAVLGDMQDVRVSNYQPSDLARAIARTLDTLPDGWTAARATALANALGGPGIIPQDISAALLAVGPTAVAHHPERTKKPLAATRAKYTRAGDAALVDAVEALGHIRAGDRARGVPMLAAAIDTTLTADAIYVSAADFVWCATQLPRDIPERDALIANAFKRIARHQPDGARRAIERIFAAIDLQEAALAGTSLVAAGVPAEALEAARDQLGELVATMLDDAELLRLEAAADPVTATRRVQQAARHLARRGHHANADTLAKLSGLAA